MTMSKTLPGARKIFRPPGVGKTVIPSDVESDLDWELVLSIKLKMTWGLATVNVHRKITDPR